MLKLNHKNLIAWQKSLLLIKEIYKLARKLPKEELYIISSQIRRAAVSVDSNIAEGASRKSLIERKRFYTIARSSLVEVDTQLEVCISLEYFTIEEIQPAISEMNNIFALLTAMINNTK